MFIAILAAAGASCHSPVVHDGNALRCGAERIRIEDMGSPELLNSPKCPESRARRAWCDDRARDALRAFLSRGTVAIRRNGIDRYGRTLARVTVNGRDPGEYLVARELAERWR